MKKKKILWIICVVAIAMTTILGLFFIHKQEVSKNITKLYYQIYESDDNVFDICRKTHSKGLEAKYNLSEIITIAYICKCVIEENKEIFINAFKYLPKEQQKGVEGKIIYNLKEVMASDLTQSIVICSSELEEKGFKYFKRKYGNIITK